MRHSLKTIVAGSLFMVTAALSGVRAHGQAPGGQHPSYLVVLSDLRSAYGLLNVPSNKQSVDQAQGAAKSEIGQAIDLIRRAAADDHKSLDSHPQIDAHFKDADRFQKAQELLNQAHRDLDAAEDVHEAHDLKGKAITHINAAWKSTAQAYEFSRK